MPVDPDFHRPALVDRIVRGAAQPDAVRMHGAIVAALELYGRDDALRGVFVPALRRARVEHGRAVRNVVAAAIAAHLRGYQSASE
ncbi:MAG TPA: hypothetical protein VGL44_02440 [Gaiellales bacterium]|jgi:hypothetical protein